jgi:hypothetical protein
MEAFTRPNRLTRKGLLRPPPLHRKGGEVKALTIRQPWAWLILHGGKDIENRDWQTSFRGRMLVHAAKGMTRQEYENAIDPMWAQGGAVIEIPSLHDLVLGTIIGSVEVLGIVTSSESPWFVGTYGWQLANPITFLEPIPYKGMLSLFDVPDHLLPEKR